MIRIVIYFQIGQTDGQQVDEKMFSITSHQGNATLTSIIDHWKNRSLD